MSALMLIVYLAFVVLAAFGKSIMTTTVGGTALSVGILLGLAVIVFAFVLTGVYVRRANATFDNLAERLTRSHR